MEEVFYSSLEVHDEEQILFFPNTLHFYCYRKLVSFLLVITIVIDPVSICLVGFLNKYYPMAGSEIIIFKLRMQTSVEVKLEDETLWLTQSQMQSLFHKTNRILAFI